MKIKEKKNVFVKETINPNFSLWLKNSKKFIFSDGVGFRSYCKTSLFKSYCSFLTLYGMEVWALRGWLVSWVAGCCFELEIDASAFLFQHAFAAWVCWACDVGSFLLMFFFSLICVC